MAKQLFNSTEKSNFILNMTEEGYSRLASFGLALSCYSTSLFALIPELTSKASSSIVTGGLAVSGVTCMVIALIAVIKKYIEKKSLLPVCAFLAMFIWGIISLINSNNKNISLYGFPGRGEGLLAIMFYLSFFTAAISVKHEKAIMTVINSVIISGLINSVFGLIQVFTGKLSHYRYISMKINSNSASGLSQSPIFLAMVLSLSLSAALIGAVMTDNKKRRIFCIVSACIFSFVMMFTYSLAGICGIVMAVIMGAIAVFISKAPKIRLLSVLSAILPPIAAVIIVNAGLIGNLTSYKLYDGYTLWFADSYMRLSSSGDYNGDVVDISNTKDVYLYLNDRTMTIIGSHSIVGTGPDQLVYPQLYTDGGLDRELADINDLIVLNKGTFDRVYNEYLYTAATRGIPSLIALLLVLIPLILGGIKKLKKESNRKNEVVLTTFMLTLCGVLIFFIGCTNITFSPIFWTIAGLSASSAAGSKS